MQVVRQRRDRRPRPLPRHRSSYSQADEAIIANLDLPLQVVYSGSEAATVAALDSAVSSESPILMYWWVPTAAAGKYNLVEVELPEYTEECYADPAEIACAYPEDVLHQDRLGGHSPRRTRRSATSSPGSR